MNKFDLVKELFENAQNPENAASMSAYMKNKFGFYGITAPERKELYKKFLKSEKSSKTIDWNFLDKCYNDDHREMQYLVYDYLLSMKKYLSFEDIDKIKYYIITKSWWDTIDFLCKVIGDIGLRDNRVSELMIEWSNSDNIWLKRTAIQHQLTYKEKTNAELIERIILNCLNTNEFFVNKAIGWSLREYSKTDAEWVRNFISKHKDELSVLSIKEASKYI